MPCLVAVWAGSLFPHTVVWALRCGQQPVNLSTAKGLARSKTGLPITLVGTRDKREAHHTLLTAIHAVRHTDSASIVDSSLPSTTS